MASTAPNDSRRLTLLFGLTAVALLPLMLLASRHHGASYDELVQHTYGRLVVDFFKSGRTDHGAEEFSNLKYYGGLFDGLMAAVERAFPTVHVMTIRHAGEAFFGWLCVLFTGLISRRFAGSAAGILAMMAMVASPVFLGHSILNPKDVPFAACLCAALHFSLCWRSAFPYYDPKTLLFLALATTLAMNVRVGGVVFVAELGAFFALAALLDPRRSVLRFIGAIGVWAALAFGSMVGGTAFWPWAQREPFTRPFEALALFSKFNEWINPVSFAGEEIMSNALPWYYVPWHYLIQTPLIIVAGVALGLVGVAIVLFKALRARALSEEHQTWLRGALMVLTFSVGPVAYVIWKKSVLYDGFRHLLFVYPPLVAFAACAFVLTFRRTGRALRWGLVALVTLGLLEPLAFELKNHPYEYTYYNQLVGGPAKAYRHYELDYWGLCLGEALAWVEAQHKEAPYASRPKVVVDMDWAHLEPFYEAAFPALDVVQTGTPSDFTAKVMRDSHAQLDRWSAIEGLAHTVSIEGVPLCVVRRNAPLAP